LLANGTQLEQDLAPRAVTLSMVRGPHAGLALLEELEADGRLAGHHRLDAVRAHLLEMAGDLAGARASYRTAARRTTSLPEQRYLEGRAARTGEGEHDPVSPAGIEREWTRRRTE
jgi:predicted RNA polymerase sigma factor